MNMLDYIAKYGNKTFDELPFNDVDNAILCQITYVSYENIINYKNEYTVKELSDLYFNKYSDKDIKKDKSLIAKSPLVLRDMAKCIRFKNIKMHHFVSYSSRIGSYQFAAMQFDLGDGTTYVSFRGTDDQLLGWKEDFQMAYRMISGYKYARRYINLYCSLFKKYRVGGHSKGGALAIYGVTNCLSIKRKNIINVYSNDGPGIKKEYIGNKMEMIKDRFIKIVPEDDIIGIIFDDDYDHIIVKSNASGVSQHDMMTWQIKNDSFVKTKSLSNNSIKLRFSFNNYIESVSKFELVKITNSLFDFFDRIDIKKVSELFSLSINSIPKLLKNIPEIDEETNKIIMNIIWVVIESHLPSLSISSGKIKKNRGKK